MTDLLNWNAGLPGWNERPSLNVGTIIRGAVRYNWGNMIDRIDYCVDACKGKRVCDIGGSLMPHATCGWRNYYSRIRDVAKSYSVIDCHGPVDLNVDLNTQAGVDDLGRYIQDNTFDVILCCEVLEHIERHREVMDMLRAQIQSGARVIISLPNGLNWISHVMGWHKPHLFHFSRQPALNFFGLMKQPFTCRGYFSKRSWHWPLTLMASLGQPFGWLADFNPNKM